MRTWAWNTDLMTSTLFSPSSSLALSRNSVTSPFPPSTTNSPPPPRFSSAIPFASLTPPVAHSAKLNCGPTSQNPSNVFFAISAISGAKSPTQQTMTPSMMERSWCVLVRESSLTSQDLSGARQRAEEGWSSYMSDRQRCREAETISRTKVRRDTVEWSVYSRTSPPPMTCTTSSFCSAICAN